jgi:iron complex transport system permease protein
MSERSGTSGAISPSGLVLTAGALLLLTAAVGLLCSFSGPIPVMEATGGRFWESLVWQNRLSRVAAAALAGGGLSLAGMALQALLRNPLAEPYILGISSGSGVGVIIGLSLAARTALPSFVTTPLLAFLGAVATCAVVYGVAQRRGLLDPYSLILSGVMINAVNIAIILSIYLFIDPHTLSGYVGWSIGQVPDAVPLFDLLVCGALVAAASAQVLVRGAAFNALSLGDAVAASSGVPVHRLRIESFLLSGLITACAVSLVGPIGFVGLFVPHLCRMVVGPDHRRLAVVSGFAGAIFLIACDTLCRQIGMAADLGKFPVGIVTALLGGPFFIWLLRNRYRTVVS